jgi:hypothetical protein
LKLTTTFPPCNSAFEPSTWPEAIQEASRHGVLGPSKAFLSPHQG